MNDYSGLLALVQEKHNCSEIRAVYLTRLLSETLRETTFTVDSPAMREMVETVFQIPREFTEMLWEFTETELKLCYTGLTFMGLPVKLSISVKCSLEELEKFDSMVDENFETKNKQIIGITE